MGTPRRTRLPGLTDLAGPRVALLGALCQNRGAVPTYDYQCRSCGSITEVIHSMLDPGPTACERCGGELRRVLYPAGIIFKGSGFYRTDSRNGSDGSKGKKPTEVKDSAAPSETTSATESKPASSPASKSSEKAASKD